MPAWWKERRHDLGRWAGTLWRDFPRRLRRLLPPWSPRPGVPAALPLPLFGLHYVFAVLFDLFGGLELVQNWLRLGAQLTPLTRAEKEAAAAVLGENGLRYQQVRIASGGWLDLVFRLNGRRAFALGHTIFMPPRARADLSLLLHELVHTCQYEQLGCRYIGEAVYAQWRLGRSCYDYGGVNGLLAATRAGKPYASFNREAQAQIVQDYFRRREQGQDVGAYLSFVEAMQRGKF